MPKTKMGLDTATLLLRALPIEDKEESQPPIVLLGMFQHLISGTAWPDPTMLEEHPLRSSTP
jgi:hypothetical protein